MAIGQHQIVQMKQRILGLGVVGNIRHVLDCDRPFRKLRNSGLGQLPGRQDLRAGIAGPDVDKMCLARPFRPAEHELAAGPGKRGVQHRHCHRIGGGDKEIIPPQRRFRRKVKAQLLGHWSVQSASLWALP